MKQSKDEATDILLKNEEKQKKDAEQQSSVPREPIDVLEALNTIIKSYLPAPSTKFDLYAFREKLFLDNQYSVNKTWYSDHIVMACPARHFLERFSVQGEFFEKYD